MAAAVAIEDRVVLRLAPSLALHVGLGSWSQGVVTASLWRLSRDGQLQEHLVFTSTDRPDRTLRLTRDEERRMLWINGTAFEIGADAALQRLRRFFEANAIPFDDDGAH